MADRVPKFIEVDVEQGENVALGLTRMFSALDQPKPVTRVKTFGPQGGEDWWEVTGWSSGGVCPAYAAIVEDSGDGSALLVFGGDQGVRLRPAGSTEPWDIGNSSQWGEACLLLAQDTEVA